MCGGAGRCRIYCIIRNYPGKYDTQISRDNIYVDVSRICKNNNNNYHQKQLIKNGRIITEKEIQTSRSDFVNHVLYLRIMYNNSVLCNFVKEVERKENIHTGFSHTVTLAEKSKPREPRLSLHFPSTTAVGKGRG